MVQVKHLTQPRTLKKKLIATSLDLSHLKYAVLAMGSQDYPETYCSFGHRIDAWLKHSGAQQLFATLEVNNGNNADIPTLE